MKDWRYKKEFQYGLNEIRNELLNANNRIKSRLDNFRRSLISSIHSIADQNDLKKFIKKEIGALENAEILVTQIEQMYIEEFESLFKHLNDIQNALKRYLLLMKK